MSELTDCQENRSQVFYIRVLPYLLFPGSPFGLADVLHADALKAAEHYGTLNGFWFGTVEL